jgi:hypothetical protein
MTIHYTTDEKAKVVSVAVNTNSDGITCLYMNNEEVAYFEETGTMVLLTIADTSLPLELIGPDGFLKIEKASL